MLNKVILIGNLGADVDLRYMTNGDPVANFSVATSERWKDKNSGEQREKTEWHRVSCFGKLAEICGQYLHKGSKVYIEGSIQYREYEKDGVKKYATDIKAMTMKMLDPKPQGAGQNQRSDAPNAGQSQPNAGGDGQPGPDDFDDDIPF